MQKIRGSVKGRTLGSPGCCCGQSGHSDTVLWLRSKVGASVDLTEGRKFPAPIERKCFLCFLGRTFVRTSLYKRQHRDTGLQQRVRQRSPYPATCVKHP
eukprot:937158-Pelagomonas_calceolata.AAC.1